MPGITKLRINKLDELGFWASDWDLSIGYSSGRR
jgi:hypothetical protein